MPITAVCDCGKSYTLKDELAGKSIKCPACSQTFVVPASRRIAQADPIFDRDKFLIKQKRIALSAKYFVGDESGNEIAFVHRPIFFLRTMFMIFLCVAWCIGLSVGMAVLFEGPAKGRRAEEGLLVSLLPLLMFAGIVGILYLFSPYRHVHFYRDRTMKDLILTVRQDVRFALINFRYTLLDVDGQELLRFRKNVLYNIFRKRWYVEQLDGEPFCMALEDSILLSLLRRTLGQVFGPLAMLFRTNFIITTDDGKDVLGEFNRKLTVFDKYVLDLTRDPDRTLDRRVALALGVMLDTGEGR